MAGLFYNDAQGTPFELEVESGGEGGEQRPVHGLPASIVLKFSAIQDAVESLSNLITDGKLAVFEDGAVTRLEQVVQGLWTFTGDLAGAKLDAVHAAVVSVEARVFDLINGIVGESKFDTLHSDLLAISGYVDGLETKLDSVIAGLGTVAGHVDAVETKLDSVITGLAAPTAGFFGAETVGMTAAQIDTGTSHALKVGVRIQNIHAGNVLYVGLANTVSDVTGWKLAPGEVLPLPIDNLNKLWLFGSAASTTYRYIAV